MMENQDENIKEWTKEGKKRKSKGFIDMCDMFDYSHYPIFFGGPKDPYKTANAALRRKENSYANMQRSFGIFKIAYAKKKKRK